MSPAFVRRFFVGLCLAGLAGCASDGRVVLRGRVVADGQPVPAGEPPVALEVLLQAEGTGTDPGTEYVAPVDPDGTFTVRGGDGKGIPPATYQFAVRAAADRPLGQASPPVPLRGVADLASSPLRCEIAAGDRRVVIDVTKKTVQKEP